MDKPKVDTSNKRNGTNLINDSILFLLLALFVFPRLVHEPLHLLATYLIGGEGTIHIFVLKPFIDATYTYTEFNVWMFLCFPIFIQSVIMVLLSSSNKSIGVLGFNAGLALDFCLQFLGRYNQFSDLRLIGNGSLYSLVVISMMSIAMFMFFIHLFRYIVKYIKEDNLTNIQYRHAKANTHTTMSEG